MANESNEVIREKVWEFVKDDFIELVKSIESKPETTRNRYGGYMNTLSLLRSGWANTLSTQAFANLLIRAGGNKQGILDAVKVLDGGSE